MNNTNIRKHQAVMKCIIAFLFIVLGTISFAQTTDSTKMVMAESKIIHSKILGEQRRIHIHTPPNSKPGETFPVLYLLDGEAHMGMVSGQVQYLAEAYKIIPSLIVVGIENTDRTRDLTPTHFNLKPDGTVDSSANAFGRNSGGGEKFLQFIREELMPFVEKNYPAASYKILSGHSLGALMAVYCLVQHPDDFNAYIAISPSLQWHNEVVLQQAAQKLDGNKTLQKILFYSDANEGGSFHTNQLKLDSLLRKKNIIGLQYRYVHYPDETHISEPVKAFYDGIRHVYPSWFLPYNSMRQTLNAPTVIHHYDSLSIKYGYTVVPQQDEIISLSRFLRNDPKRINDAIMLLEKYGAHYPKATNMMELLGDIYHNAGDPVKARASYTKALQLQPTNEKLQQKLKDINQ